MSMLRTVWIITGSVIAAVAGWLAATTAPAGRLLASVAVPDAAAATAIAGSVPMALAIGLSVAALAAFVLVFLVLAVVDGWIVARAIRGIERFPLTAGDGEDARDRFAALFDAAPAEVRATAEDYATSLRRGRGEPGRDASGEPLWHGGTPPEASFTRELLVDTPLKLTFFGGVPVALAGFGVAALALGLLPGLTAGSIPAAAAASAAGLLALASAMAAAVVIGLGQRFVLALRHAQAARLCRAIRGAFPIAVEPMAAGGEVLSLQAWQVDRSGRQWQELTRRLLELAATVNTSNESNVNRTTAALQELRQGLQTLAETVAPGLDRLAEVQDRTLAALHEERLGGRAVAGRIDELTDRARALAASADSIAGLVDSMHASLDRLASASPAHSPDRPNGHAVKDLAVLESMSRELYDLFRKEGDADGSDALPQRRPTPPPGRARGSADSD